VFVHALADDDENTIKSRFLTEPLHAPLSEAEKTSRNAY